MRSLKDISEMVYLKLLANGNVMYPEETTGYAVDIPGFKLILPMSSLNPVQIERFIGFNLRSLNGFERNAALVGQIDRNRNISCLDIIQLTPDRVEARMLSMMYNQGVFHDLDNKTNVTVKVIGRDGYYEGV